MKIPKHNELNSNNYTDFNAQIINEWIDEEQYWGPVTSHEEYVRAKNGDWEIGLAFDITPKEWFLPYIDLENNKLDGTKLLGLASGGGQQMPILVASGADCTIMDYSDSQLACEKLVAKREGYKINIVKADMTKRFPFEDNSFDIIVNVVSNHFVEDVYHVWNECYRVLKPGGILLAGMVNGICYVFADDYDDDDENATLAAVNKLPYNPLKSTKLYDKLMALDDGYNLEFSHTMEELLGGQLKAGLNLTNITEARDASCLISKYFPEYLSTRALKPNST
ncbi:MAG: class I SAM-dependent methyltransferase [Oscillospiraceae bacterium]|nr:class I SAM-dependent methyltransferase [Oscillospiraceae bacterium]